VSVDANREWTCNGSEIVGVDDLSSESRSRVDPELSDVMISAPIRGQEILILYIDPDRTRQSLCIYIVRSVHCALVS
jgi:hypothetical protein